jgi:hypothetical protein
MLATTAQLILTEDFVMTQINQLTRASDVAAGDLVPVFSTDNGDARAAAISVLLAYMQANLDFPSTFAEYVTDGASNNTNVHLILTPTGGFAAGTITLPAKAGLADKQEVLVNCTQAVTTLTIGLNGATGAVGAPTTLAANAFFRLKYDAVTSNWYRVG